MSGGHMRKRRKKLLARQRAKERTDLSEEVGMDLNAFHPKDAVRRFFTRYTGRPATAEDYFYRCVQASDPEHEEVAAELVTPSFYWRVFRGDPCSNQKKAEASAAGIFCNDPQAQEAAAVLPPPMSKCRLFAGGAGNKRDGNVSKSTGKKVGSFKSERTRQIHQRFQNSGCGTMFDDGNG
ncbi:unnamed protein product [Symbiodinium pilosum]|uniref:Uncharacterized protein n=1 Tax=Symbiodinium pilosum TaxID=2952 RepID=A0A812Q1Q1_SYMPI|nr:unnamed protein product [Symbiodinium pilosum]